MALIKLKQYELNGGGWPNGANISFRFVNQPIGPNLASSPVNQWVNCPGNSQLNFVLTGFLCIYVNGAHRGTAAGFVGPAPTPRQNLQAAFNTIYGIADLKYEVL